MAKVTCEVCGTEWNTWQSTSCPDCFKKVQAQIREEQMAMRGQPKGWYSDPEDASAERYWNGAYWTDEVRTNGGHGFGDEDSREGSNEGLALAAMATMTYVQAIAIVVTFGALASLLAGIGVAVSLMESPNTAVAFGLFFVAGLTILAMTITSIIALVRGDALGQRAQLALRWIPGGLPKR